MPNMTIFGKAYAKSGEIQFMTTFEILYPEIRLARGGKVGSERRREKERKRT